MACIDISKLKHSSILIHSFCCLQGQLPLPFLPQSETPPYPQLVLQRPLCYLKEHDPILFQAKDVENDFFPFT